MKTNGLGWAVTETLDSVAQARERVTMGLRVIEGFALSDIEELNLQLNAAKLADYTELSLVTQQNGRIALTPGGRLMADRIAAELAP